MKAVPLEAFKADRVRQIRDHTHFYWVDPMCMPITKLSMNDAETVVAHLDSNAPGWDEHFRQRDEINWRCFDHVIAPAIARRNQGYGETPPDYKSDLGR